MQELELTWKRLLAIWWAQTWRALVGLVVIVGAAALLGMIWRFAGWPPQHAQLVGQILGFSGGVIVGFVVLRMILLKRFGDFRIALVLQEPAADKAGEISPRDTA